MGHSLARARHLVLSVALSSVGLSLALPDTSLAMSKAQTPASPSQPAASTALNSDGHRYRAIVFGGSCEEGLASNDFHDSFIQISSKLNGAGWDVRPSFGGDSAHCAGTAADPCPAGVNVSQWSVAPIAQAAGKDPSTVGRASKASLLAALDQASTDLSSGDELLVVIDTHGYGEQVKGQAYWDHGICVSSDAPHGTVANFDPATGQMNAVNKEGLMYMSDPDLQQRLKKLSTAGVKMGFLDDSCYGGGSIPQLAQYGCTMASAVSQLENFETGDSSSNADGTVESENGIAYNLPDLLSADASDLSAQSLHAHQITMEEFWMRILARSKIAGVPEYSGYMSEAAQAESLGTWLYNILGDVTYRRGNTPFTATPGNDTETSAPLVNYAQTFLASTPDAATQAGEASMVASYWASPGVAGSDDSVNTKTLTELQSTITQAPNQWSTWVGQFNALTNQETSILADLASLNINVQYSFTGALAGTEDLFNAVLPSMPQQDIFTYKVSSSGALWVEVGDSFDTPDSPDFAGNVQVAADSIYYFMNGYKLQHDHFMTGLDQSYSDSLAPMIVQAETQAWNVATTADQNRMKSDFQQLKSLRTQEAALFSALTVDTRSYLTQARMYAYLEYRKQAALVDPKLSQCADFVLKRY